MDFDNLHQVLRSLYDEMMPLCSNMIGVAKGIAGLGALFYVASRVWQSLARAEQIDVYPLLRPFAIGFCILFFSSFVLGTLNSILSPVVTGTNRMLTSQTMDMNTLRTQRDRIEREAMLRNPETAFLVSDDVFDKKIDDLGWSPKDLITMSSMYYERGMYSLKKSMQDALKSFLEILFQAAALIIDTIRTFYLIVLAILGPIAFAISVYDGFQFTLTGWLSRYITVYLWLPVSDLFSTMLAKIQTLMIGKEIKALEDPAYIPDGSNTVYIIFMLIAIVGYFVVPTVAGWIIQAGGMGNFNRSLNRGIGKGGSVAGGAAGAVGGNITGQLKK
ncbi:conjugative transposon protein TraJ [Petrimonas sp.]|uniref:conjugative transposon protein TraJ n=1 Tax=Petrimonas sp. TaxID=2023866 RepID=UPI003F5197B5